MNSKVPSMSVMGFPDSEIIRRNATNWGGIYVHVLYPNIDPFML